MKLKKILNKQRGVSYASILISLLIISIVGVTLLSAISVTKQSDVYSHKTVYASRIAESYMEKTINEVKNNPIVYNDPVIVDNGDGYKITINVTQEDTYLYKVSVNVDYSLSSLKPEQVSRNISLESLVSSI